MKQSRIFMSTNHKKEQAERLNGEQLLVTGCFVRQHDKGLYAFLPLGLRLMEKIQDTIREKMREIGAIQFRTSLLHAKEEGEKLSKQQFHVEDQYDRTYTLGSHAGEIVIPFVLEQLDHTALNDASFYYQITPYFQQVSKTNCSFMNSREKTIHEMYSFEHNETDIEVMKELFKTLFSNLHIEQYPVFQSFEPMKKYYRFIAPIPNGKERIARSSVGDFAQTIEIAPAHQVYETHEEHTLPTEKIELPTVNTLAEVSDELNIPIQKMIDTSAFIVDGELIVVVCRGDFTVSVKKLQRFLKARRVQPASTEVIQETFNCKPEFMGPTQLPVGTKIIADHSITAVINGVSGANEDHVFLQHVNPERDFAIQDYADVRFVVEGEEAPGGQGVIQFVKGIEMAVISEVSLEDYVSSEIAKDRLIGYHSIDLTKLIGVLAEQHRDAYGFTWPKSLAPFDVHIIVENEEDEAQHGIADSIYHLLKSYHYEVLYDDRFVSVEQKKIDADLIGMPIQIMINEKIQNHILNVKMRKTNETVEWQLEEITEKLQSYFTMNE